MRSYRAAMFAMHIDTFKARTMFAPRSRAVKNPFGAFLNEKGCYHLLISLHTNFLFLIFRVLTKKMILARRMKLMLLTTNQTFIFISVSEVSVDPLEKRQKNPWRGTCWALWKCRRQMKTGGLAPDAASWLGISTHVKRYDIFSRVLLGLFSGQEIPV